MSISKEAVVEKMKGNDSVVLNVLPELEYLKLHIQGSFSLPMQDGRDAFIREVEEKYGKGKLFITYGSNISSHAAIDAAESLWERGFKAEVFLSGMKEWNEAGLPTEGTQSKKPTADPS
jgi:rhodanese-related sulfurtransferase